MKNRIVAGLLAILLGSVGAHKFYLRKPGAGLFYLFLFMVFINARMPFMFILGLFEGIRLLMMSDQEFNKQYNPGMQEGQEQVSYGRGRRQIPVQDVRDPRNSQRNAPWQNVEPTSYSRRNIYKESAMRKYKEFELEGAIEDFQKSLQMEPRDIPTHFNLACAYSLTEQAEKAYQHLTKAVELGFNDFERINSHDDLAFARIQKQWDAFKASGYRKYDNFEKKPFAKEAEPIQNDLLLDQLNKLNELRQKGLITETEFAMEKKRLNE